MTTAFVLSGGASLGAVQVGMLQALAEGGVWPDLLAGTSVGAINAAYVAGHPSPDDIDGLATVWRKLRRRDIFPLRFLAGLRGFVGRSDHLVPADGLRSLLASHLTFAHLEDARIPLRVVATDVTTGDEETFATGPAMEAIVASAAIPGVFPPVRIGDRLYMDGGVADNTPLSSAVALGASTIYVLPASYPCEITTAPPSALGLVLHAINLLVHDRLTADVAKYQDDHELLVVPPLCPLDVSPVDFSHSGELIDRARASTIEWLAHRDPSADQAAVLNP